MSSLSIRRRLNFISILKVAYLGRKKTINIKFENFTFDLLIFFYKKGWILSWILIDSGVQIYLRYINNKPIFSNIKIISKSGYRVYKPKKKTIKYYKDNIDIILLTSKGLMTLKEADNLQIGGEVYFIIYY